MSTGFFDYFYYFFEKTKFTPYFCATTHKAISPQRGYGLSSGSRIFRSLGTV